MLAISLNSAKILTSVLIKLIFSIDQWSLLMRTAHNKSFQEGSYYQVKISSLVQHLIKWIIMFGSNLKCALVLFHGISISYDRVRTGPGNPGKSWNLRKSFSRPGKSWNSDAGPGKSWKYELGKSFLTCNLLLLTIRLGRPHTLWLSKFSKT